MQVLQAANNGITSLQKLVDTAKSIANQALQSAVGYSTKSNVSTTIAGATATDLRGTTSFTSANASSNVLYTGAAGGATAAATGTKLGGVSGAAIGAVTNSNSAAPITEATLIYGAAAALTTQATTKFVDGDVLTVNGKTITFTSAATPADTSVPAGSGVQRQRRQRRQRQLEVYLNAGTNGRRRALRRLILPAASGALRTPAAPRRSPALPRARRLRRSPPASVSLRSSTGADLSVTGKADLLAALGVTAALGSGTATVTATRTTDTNTLGSLLQDRFVAQRQWPDHQLRCTVPPRLLRMSRLARACIGNIVTDGSGNSTVYMQAATIADLLKAIDLATGVQTATNASGVADFDHRFRSVCLIDRRQRHAADLDRHQPDLSITGTGNALSCAWPYAATPAPAPRSPRAAPRRPAASPARP